MNIEDEIFKRTHVNFSKLEIFGFKKINNKYTYSITFMDNKFRADIIVDSKGVLTGKVIDLLVNEEYINFRISLQTGEFVNKVRDEYRGILRNIRDKCFDVDYFIFEQANRITRYIEEKYNDRPEFLWDKFKRYGVFRNKDNRKWYAIIMNTDKSKIDKGTGEIEILNIKLNANIVKELLTKKGFYKSYHMRGNDWISIILDDTVSDEEIIRLLNESYDNINKKSNNLR